MNRLKGLVADLAPDTREKILSENVRKVYKLD